MTHHDDDNLVPADDACPRCGERHIDSLVWLDDEVVRCSNCGTEYNPLAQQKGGGDATAS